MPPRRRPSPPPFALPPLPWPALEQELQQFPPRTLERGRGYARLGRVVALSAVPDGFRAVVVGERVYHTVWEWDPEGLWLSTCSCPVASDCKHAVAAALEVLQRAGEAGPAAAARGSTPPQRRATALERLRSAGSLWERESALRELIGRGPFGAPFQCSVEERLALQERDPDLRCYRLARALATGEGLELPAELSAYLERSALEERWLTHEREALARELVQWAAPRTAPVRRLRLAVLLADEGRGPFLELELRVTSRNLRDAPRSPQQIEQLRQEARRTPQGFTAAEHELLEALGPYASSYAHQGPRGSAPVQTLRRLLERGVAAPLLRWADALEPGIAARAGVVAGEPVRLDPTPIRLVPAHVDRADEAWLQLRFTWPDGSSFDPADGLFLRAADAYGRPHGSLLALRGSLHPVVEEPPPEIVQRFSECGGIPIRSLAGSDLLGALTGALPAAAAALAAHTRHVRVAPHVLVDLRDEEWLQLRVVATGARAGAHGRLTEDVAFEHAGLAGWERLPPEEAAALLERVGAQTAARSDAALEAAEPGDGPDDRREALLEAPDPDDVAPALDWVSRLGAKPGAGTGAGAPPYPDARLGSWLRASAASLEAFLVAFEHRPAGLGFFGTPAVQRLLDPGGALRPSVRVTPSGLDFFEVSAAWEGEALALDEADLALLRRADGRLVRLRGRWVRREEGALSDELERALADVGVELGGPGVRVGLHVLAGARPESLATLECLAPDPALAAAARALRERVAAFHGVPELPIPSGFEGDLRPYQRAGLDFLACASSLGLGPILADEMGLGKTVQALAWLLHLRGAEEPKGPALVVCPASVVHNWVREAARFAPGLRVLVLERGAGRQGLHDTLERYDLVVTNYALLRRDAGTWSRVDLHAAILDEAQFVKNPDAAVSRAACALRARHRLALTGTPIENRALDLWSLMAFANPGQLGDRKRFVARFEGPDASPHARASLAARLRAVLLRRTKAAVAPELPPRIEERRDCELTREQRQLYLAELRRCREIALDETGGARRLAQRRIAVLAGLTRLRQICCHPALAGGRRGIASGKFEALFELLEPLLAEGHKVLLFSQFVECLKLVGEHLRKRGIRYHQLTGATLKRERVVAAFEADPEACVFLISLKAGGTGLNLTAASYVVLFDPWWNPAVEAQAIDRAHRIGQDRTVVAYRLLARGTVEEKIYELQMRKAALAREVLGEEGFGGALTREDLLGLLADEPAAPKA